MNRWFNRLKKYFIPREDNEHQPYFLREGSVATVLVLIVLMEAAVVIPSFFILPHSKFLTVVLPDALINLTNENRTSAHLPTLETSSLLTEAAQLKAEDMAKRGYFSPESPEEGTPPWDWLKRVGYRFNAAGENLAVNFFDSQDVFHAWLKLSAYQVSIVWPNFTEVGIGVAPGRFQGRDSVYVVQFFGQPSAGTRLGAAKTGLQPNTTPRLNRVLGAAVAATRFSYWELLSIRLHTFSNQVYWALLTLAILAFLSNLLVKVRIQHPHIIVNGLILILVIFAVLFINDQLFISKLQTSYTETTAALLDK